MPSGKTFLATVEEGLDTTIASARKTREFPANVMLKVCDKDTLQEHTGSAWREFLAAQLTAQNYGETQEIDNPQELDGSILSATPQLVACQTFIGRRVQARLNAKAYGTFGTLGQDAMNRKADEDGIAMFASATTTLCGTATTLTSGHMMAGLRRISSDASEPGAEPFYFVGHGYQFYDIQDQIFACVG